MSRSVGAGWFVLSFSVLAFAACSADESNDPLVGEFRAQEDCPGGPLPDTSAVLHCGQKENGPREGLQGCEENDKLEQVSFSITEPEFLQDVRHNDLVWVVLEHYKWSTVESTSEWTSEFAFATADMQLPRVQPGNPITFAVSGNFAKDFCGINQGEWILPIALHVYPKYGGEPWILPIFNARSTGFADGDCPMEAVVDPTGWLSFPAQRKECPAKIEFPERPVFMPSSRTLCPNGRGQDDNWECAPGDTAEWVYFESSNREMVEIAAAYETDSNTVEWATAQLTASSSQPMATYNAEARVSNATVDVGVNGNKTRAYGYIHVSELTWYGGRKPSGDVSLSGVSLYARHPQGGPTIVFDLFSPRNSPPVRWP